MGQSLNTCGLTGDHKSISARFTPYSTHCTQYKLCFLSRFYFCAYLAALDTKMRISWVMRSSATSFLGSEYTPCSDLQPGNYRRKRLSRLSKSCLPLHCPRIGPASIRKSRHFLPCSATSPLSKFSTQPKQQLDSEPDSRPAWEGSSSHLGAAAIATLDVLEWGRLCRQVAGFAQTTLGQRSFASLYPATQPAACEALLAETRAVDALEAEFAADVDFGGIQTAPAAESIRRAARGGLLSGSGLVSIASLLTGAAKLQKSIKHVAKDSEFTGLGDTSVLQPVLEMFKDLVTVPEIVSEIGFAIREDGSVREGASDEVKKAAGKVRVLENRIRGILKSAAGEVTEYGGRMCIAVPASLDGPPRGILLGSGPGGSTWYVEPAAAVPLNNELFGAQGELAAAEEAILWRLTGKVGDKEEDLSRALHAVVWLDSVAAKARWGRWIGANLPRLIPFPKTGKARGRSAKKKAAAAAAAGEEQQEESTSGTADDEEIVEPSKHIVYLKKLRHPLLAGDYLLNSARDGGSGDSYHSGSDGGLDSNPSGGNGKREQRLPGWRPNPLKRDIIGESSIGNSLKGFDSSSDSDSEGSLITGDTSTTTSKAPSPPVPIDVTISSTTRAVVITGPNTGGKTAAMKALGLAAVAARAGLPIPAADPVLLPSFDAVLADIGDEQSLSASLSTFSGHLRRIEALRAESTGRSLVLLDELGTGTDPTEGAALGIALLRVLSNGGQGGAALTVATTHHSALTALKYEENGGKGEKKVVNPKAEQQTPGGGSDDSSNIEANSSSDNGISSKNSGFAGNNSGITVGLSGPTFENASVEFDEVKLAPTYRLLWGVPGRSNALNIAQRLGLDRELVDEARERLGVAAAAVNESIIELEDARKEQVENESVAAAAEERAKELRTQTIALR